VTRTPAPRVVTLGELLLRLSPPGEERLLESPQLLTCFGGAEANVAVGLSHLGVRCDYVTRLPANPIGDAGLEALRAEGVGTRWIVRGGERLGIYFVEPGSDLRAMRVVYDRAGSAFARIDPRAIDWPAVLADANWLHASGITPALGDAPAATLASAVACARDHEIAVSLDLNYREALWGDRDPRPLVEPLARQATVLIANPTAVRAMLGIDADDSSLATPKRARELAERLADRCGAKRVALTRREILGAREHGWSAVLYDAETRSFAASRRHCVQVVDRVGGGDSFAAALIARLLGGDPLAEALEFAVAASALKLTVPGDFSRASVGDVEDLLRT
jgi:2-dehydro-3-deoxygluconokinase